MPDQKSVTAPEERLTGGLDGAFFCALIFVLCGLAQPDARACAGFIYTTWALLALVTIHIRTKNGFGQAFTIATLTSPRLSRCRTPAFALVRYQCVEIFYDLDAVSV